jgi:succinate dehydrogenase/fumarate reductase cytochrome b subunit
MKRTAILLLTLSPFITHADSAQEDIKNILTFSNTKLLPFILGIGFLFVVINGVRYFVFEGTSEKGQEKAKALAIYGVAAFVVIVIFWGVVNLLASSLGFDTEKAPTPDYLDHAAK